MRLNDAYWLSETKKKIRYLQFSIRNVQYDEMIKCRYLHVVPTGVQQHLEIFTPTERSRIQLSKLLARFAQFVLQFRALVVQRRYQVSLLSQLVVHAVFLVLQQLARGQS